jgi:hypothetical protein
LATLTFILSNMRPCPSQLMKHQSIDEAPLLR